MADIYTEDVHMVYYELLKKNVSIENCEHVLFKVVLERLAHKSVEKLPRKSLAATMMVEAEILSKIQVCEAMLNSNHNILPTDGTKYNFKEIGSYQVN